MASFGVGALAEAILLEVEKEKSLAKEAQEAPPSLETPLGTSLMKVAEAVREYGSSDITYSDLREFRKRYGV